MGLEQQGYPPKQSEQLVSHLEGGACICRRWHSLLRGLVPHCDAVGLHMPLSGHRRPSLQRQGSEYGKAAGWVFSYIILITMHPRIQSV